MEVLGGVRTIAIEMARRTPFGRFLKRGGGAKVLPSRNSGIHAILCCWCYSCIDRVGFATRIEIGSIMRGYLPYRPN